MGNGLTIAFGQQEIRTIKTDRGIEWVAADVCEVLDIKQTHRALANFKPSERGSHFMTTPYGGTQEVSTVTEPGLYRLIMRSNKPEAERFREWLTHEVLPCIRKHGCYPAPLVEIDNRAVVSTDASMICRQMGMEIIAGMREAMSRDIRTAIDPLEKKIDAHGSKLDEFGARIDNLERRRSLTKETKQRHIYAVAQLGGKCPCCCKVLIVNSGNQKLAAGEFDHWKSKALNDLQNTWLICSDCNSNLNNREFRDSVEIHFVAYQRRLREIRHAIGTPAFPGFEEGVL
jgi:prophage antirepressor-like protein/uncharacterized CHY-type Zn-finger protein